MAVISVRFQRSWGFHGMRPEWGGERHPMEISTFHTLLPPCSFHVYLFLGAMSGCLCISS